jgi:hypothetical protein
MNHALWRTARTLYITALIIFVITVVIGILNGTDIFAFGRGEGLVEVEEGLGRRLLLTHLHAGTLGFITLAVVAGAMRMFTEGAGPGETARSSGRGVGVAMAVSIGAYVIAFATTTGILRPIAGTLVFLAVGWLFVWVVRQMRGRPITVPQLAVFGALISLVIGAIFGILLGIFVSEGSIPGVSEDMGPRIGGAHPGTMVVGYLILAGLGLIEWLITDRQRPIRTNRWGVVQVAVVFLAGMAVLIGILADNFQIAAINVPFEVIGVVIFLVRMRRELSPSRWGASVSGLYGRLAIIWLIAAIVALAVIIVGIVSETYADFEDLPTGLLLAFDHMNFIGVMTMVTFGLIVAAIGRNGRSDRLIVGAINVGLLLFVLGLLLDQAVLKRIGTPVLGIALLWGIWFYVRQLRATPDPVAVAVL